MSDHDCQSGLTLIEVLVAITLLAILLVPALRALDTGFVGSRVHVDVSVDHYRLVSRMENVLAETYSVLDAAAAGATTPSSYSDAVGTPQRILVFIAGYDLDNADGDIDVFTGADPDVLWVRVAAEGTPHDLASLKSR